MGKRDALRVPVPSDYCGHCGEVLALFGLNRGNAPRGYDGTLYCSESCRDEAQETLTEARVGARRGYSS